MAKTKVNPRTGSPVPHVKPNTKSSSTVVNSNPTIGPLLSSSTYAVTLLAYFWYTLSKGKLVTDPVRTLSENTIALVLIQLVYCISGGLDGQNVVKKQKGEDGISTKISVS